VGIANGKSTVRAVEPRTEGVLRLLHIGSLEHLPTYTSLEFLLAKVFPQLDAEILTCLKVEVIGKINPNGKRDKAIMELARPYPMVRFSGFVDEIRTAYARNDLQVVASTQATGVRTRIIESWAFGMPVLSTTVGAGGLEGLAPDKNILIADDPGDFARTLEELLRAPQRLDEIASAARRTYEEYYSRSVIAARFGALLNKHFGLQLSA
jgi:glycosyltransferase involved in cell wall biosynthesis